MVDYADASDQKVLTLGARAALRASASEPDGDDTRFDGAPCREVKVTEARLARMEATTAKGPASVPAWSYTVEGLPGPLVLPAVRVTTAAEVSPGADHRPYWLEPAWSEWVVSREGTTFQVSLQVPSCDTSHYRPHLLETDAAIVVWATTTPTDQGVRCTAARRGDIHTARAHRRPSRGWPGGVPLPPYRVSLNGWP